MLADLQVIPTLPASNMDRARQFYTERLGLTPDTDISGDILFRSGGGTQVLVFASQGAASGSHTQVTWITTDIEREVADLKSRGVVFEDYDLPGLKTVNSIATLGPAKTAWFKDSEGNLLAVTQLS